MADVKFSISTFSAASVKDVIKLLRENKIDLPYYPRAVTSFLFSVFAAPFRFWEHIRYEDLSNQYEIKEDPVFILGHWRCGTTYLHNLLCEDPNAGFVSTYQGVFPEQLFGGKWVFKTFMKIFMPEKRISDNMPLRADYPQEEEFAIANVNTYSYYNFFCFPKRTRDFYKKFIDFEGVPENVIASWKNDYLRLVKRALINTNGKRFVSKNPPHTGRVKLLLELFPNAKFIHIYRNPVKVFVSTKKFFLPQLPVVQLQDISEQEVEDNIFWVYKRMMHTYLEERSLIKPENIIEVRFEDLEIEPMSQLQKIYKHLNIPEFEKAKPHFERHINAQKTYKKNRYKMSRTMVDKISSEWKFAMDEWNYTIPDNIDIID